jgi:hypothetical protein
LCFCDTRQCQSVVPSISSSYGILILGIPKRVTKT